MTSIDAKDYQKYISLGLIVLIIVLAFFVIKPFILAIISAIVLAYLLYPLHIYITGKVKREWVSALIVCVLVILALVIPLIFITNSLRVQALHVYASTSNYLSQNQNAITDLQNSISANFGVDFEIKDLVLSVFNFFASASKDFLSSLPERMLQFFVMLFMLYYLLKDGEEISKKALHLLPLKKEVRSKISTDTKELANAIVYGSLLTALIQGIIGGIGFLIFGISSPIFWGFMMAIFALIPFVGTGLIWGPAGIILIGKGIFLHSGLTIAKGIGLLIYGAILVSTVDNIIKPKLISKKSNIHPAIVLLGIFGGLKLFGIIGLILGPLTLALFIGLIKIYSEEYGI